MRVHAKRQSVSASTPDRQPGSAPHSTPTAIWRQDSVRETHIYLSPSLHNHDRHHDPDTALPDTCTRLGQSSRRRHGFASNLLSKQSKLTGDPSGLGAALAGVGHATNPSTSTQPKLTQPASEEHTASGGKQSKDSAGYWGPYRGSAQAWVVSWGDQRVHSRRESLLLALRHKAARVQRVASVGSAERARGRLQRKESRPGLGAGVLFAAPAGQLCANRGEEIAVEVAVHHVARHASERLRNARQPCPEGCQQESGGLCCLN
eukprot:380372-Rhodomonas_salina.2